jgi:TonB family protein
VVAASVSPTYAGQRVEIAFTVDANGTVSGFSAKSSPDAAMAERVMDAVRRWRFQPAVSGGVAVATKAVLPVTITEDRVVVARFAARQGINKPNNQPRVHLKAGALW